MRPTTPALPVPRLALGLLALAPGVLACPPQDAAAPPGTGTALERPPLETVLARLRKAVGAAEAPLQLSGTERVQGLEGPSYLNLSPNGLFVERGESRLGDQLGWDGEVAWNVGFDGSLRILELEDRDEALLTAWLVQGYWLDRRAPVEVSWAADDGDGTTLVVALRERPLRLSVVLDPATGLPRELSRTAAGGRRTWTLSDWRVVEGLRLPFRIDVDEEGGPPSWKRYESATQLPAFVRNPYHPPAVELDDVSFDPGRGLELEARKLRSGHVIVHPLVEGEDVGWFFLDSGAGAMCIDPLAADEVELESFGEVLAVGVAGRQTASFRQGTSFELGRLRFEDPVYVEIDLSPVASMLGEEIVGICGYDVFARSLVELEPETGRVFLTDPDAFELGGGEWQPLVLDGRLPCVRASFEGDHEGYFRLDTGSGGTVHFHTPTVERLALLEGRDLSRSMSGGVGGSAPTWQGQIGWFELSGHRFLSPVVDFATTKVGALADEYTMGNLGQAFLDPFRIVFDYPHRRIAFVPRAE